MLEDHRPFDTDVSIETFFKKCNITLTFTKDTDVDLRQPYNYICRYRLVPVNKRKFQIEPVLEEERKAIDLLRTPAKATIRGQSKTPSSLVRRLSRVSISEQKNWSVSKNDGTKLLLKRAILTDKNEKDSPKKVTPKPTPKKSETPRSSKNLTKTNIEEVLSMELKEDSDDELPTLIIRQHVATTPKRKTSIAKTNETPKKVLLFEDDEKPSSATVTRSGRSTRKLVSYIEEDVSPVKRTPRKIVNKMDIDDSDDEFKPVPKTPKTPKTSQTPRTARTPRTPKTPRFTPRRTPRGRKILHDQNPAEPFENLEGKMR